MKIKKVEGVWGVWSGDVMLKEVASYSKGAAYIRQVQGDVDNNFEANVHSITERA